MKTHTSNRSEGTEATDRQKAGAVQRAPSPAGPTAKVADTRACASSLQHHQQMANASPQAMQFQRRKELMALSTSAESLRATQLHLKEPVQLAQDEESPQGKFAPAGRQEEDGVLQASTSLVEETAAASVHRAENSYHTGLPDQLKSGIEALSGMGLDHVRVHYNSDKPAQLQAHAYAQGSEIHIGPGQERHLPHEAWHVVQQAQGRVGPTATVRGEQVNDNPALESEATAMGEGALRSVAGRAQDRRPDSTGTIANGIAQGAWWYLNDDSPQLSQNPEPGDVSADEAYDYVVRTYHKRIVEIDVPFSPAAMRIENGWIRLPLPQVQGRQAQDIDMQGQQAEEIAEPASEASALPEQQAIPEEEAGEIEAAIEADKDASENIQQILRLLAAAYLPIFIAWQTFRKHQGRNPGGRGAHASAHLFEQLNDMIASFNSAVNTDVRIKEIIDQPVWEGFRAGVDVRPMPIASQYAGLGELCQSAFEIAFLLLAKKEEINFFIASVLQDPAPVRPEGIEGEFPLSASAIGVRNKLIKGYVGGSLTSTAIFGVAGLTGFSHPSMNAQFFWDGLHVVNAYSIQARQLAAAQESQQQALIKRIRRSMQQEGRLAVRRYINAAAGNIGLQGAMPLIQKGVRLLFRK